MTAARLSEAREARQAIRLHRRAGIEVAAGPRRQLPLPQARYVPELHPLRAPVRRHLPHHERRLPWRVPPPRAVAARGVVHLYDPLTGGRFVAFLHYLQQIVLFLLGRVLAHAQLAPPFQGRHAKGFRVRVENSTVWQSMSRMVPMPTSSKAGRPRCA